MYTSRRRTKIIIVVFIIAAAIVAANFFEGSVKSFFYAVSSPVQKSLWAAGKNASNFFASISSSANLKKERDELNFKNQELLVRIAGLEEIQKENADLKCALDIKLNEQFKMNMVQIVGKDISQDSILIDKGAKDGLNKGMPVITGQKVVVGRISEAYESFSKVMLISNKDSSFDGQVREREISAIVKGNGNLKMFFDLIPQDKRIEPGDVVVTSSLAGFFPEGLLVGKIADVKRNDLESFQQANIESAFDVNNLNFLFVITGR